MKKDYKRDYESKADEAERYFKKGLESIKNKDILSGLANFEKALEIKKVPIYKSYLAYCISRERGQFNRAMILCEEAIREEPYNPVHYLNLGRIYLLQGNKPEAIKSFRKGLEYNREPEIVMELEKLGTRKRPPIPFLKRENFLNKYLGILLKKLGLR